jgi:hypothetical protein
MNFRTAKKLGLVSASTNLAYHPLAGSGALTRAATTGGGIRAGGFSRKPRLR